MILPFHWLVVKKELKSSILLDNPEAYQGEVVSCRRGVLDTLMNNPAIKRLAKELQEIQQFNKTEDDNFEECDENFIEATPLKVPNNSIFTIFDFVG